MASPSLALRTLLIAFTPALAALTVSYFAVRSSVSDMARAGLREAHHEMQRTLEAVRTRHDARRQVLLQALAAQPGVRDLAAAVAAGGPPEQSRGRAIERALTMLNNGIEFDLLVLSNPSLHPVAGLARGREGEKALRGVFLPPELPDGRGEFLFVDKNLFQVTTVPLEIEGQLAAHLTVGEKVEVGLETGSSDLLFVQAGKLVYSTLRRARTAELEAQLREKCAETARECDIQSGEELLAASLRKAGKKPYPYQLYSVQPIEGASQHFLHAALKVFTAVAAVTLLLVFVLSLIGSRSVAQPLAGLLATLRHAQQTGQLRGGLRTQWGTQEVDQLAEAFNNAAESIASKQKQLDSAYREFVESMARTLDARDPYTAGHSLRVAHYSRAIAMKLGLPECDTEIIETGARLHDIGKIGIPDAVLQKPGHLTDDEFKIIKMHPQIGKRMLKRVGGFEAYLPIVEFHHENHDGTGYPYGLRGKDIPIGARIVHVTDAYDAMTSHRTYRKAMPHNRALQVLRQCAGSQFDPEVVRAFEELFPADRGHKLDTELPVQLLA